MHDLLRRLAGFRPGWEARYGLPVLSVGLATVLRLVAPLDVAPFLLFLPVIVLLALALGRVSSAVGLVLSAVAAACFFTRDEEAWRLSTGEVIALAQYVVVGGVMALICGSLRQAVVDNEGNVARLDEANRFLTASREHLKGAREEAIEARDTAEAANRAKSEFLANMSHELRTPLSAIIGYSEMMLEEIEDGGDLGLVSDMRKIQGNARHLLGLINDVLDLSKIESGKMEVYAEEFTVDSMLRDLETTVGSLVSKKGNTLELRLPPDLGLMRSDLTKTRQILLNFLSNAAKFTEGGTITLSASRESGPDGSDRVSFAVSDTGIGMSDEQVSRLFQRFEQADASTTRRFGGSGLGLSLTRAFADMLGGHVSVASEAGRGSTFTLVLPATYVAPETDDASPDPDVVTDEEGGRDLVLVIDDDADQRTLTTRFLHREGFRVQVAANGRAGLDLARRLRPRAILLDVMMPGIDGWSVLSEIKADPDLSAIPVVMVTAVDQRNLAASLGAADYMMKPVDWTRFSKVMDRFRLAEPGGRGTALLVEDDAIIRMSMRATLEGDGWTVAEAGDGRQGLAQASTRPPQVAIVDLNMPVMDGFTFLSELRALPGCADIPVVVMTGRELSAEDRRTLRGASQILNRGDLGSADLVNRLRHLADERERPDATTAIGRDGLVPAGRLPAPPGGPGGRPHASDRL